ncbi:MAG TPA: response regulator, partial [Burkholderiaceae bacterium]
KGGLGIGLALVRQLVELHGGSVSADSDGNGNGSVFVVRLPQVQPLKAAETQGAPAAAAGVSRVLLVEDNEDGRDMMAMMLSSHGLDVVAAEDGLAGLEAARTAEADVGLIDIGLPGIDGYEVARRLRADPRTSSMKLIALTGYGLAEDQRLALEAGFDLHLVKPVDINALMKAISSFAVTAETGA